MSDPTIWPQDRPSLGADPHRPVYHFTPPRNWMNDPNGLIEFPGEGGRFHLFYQHNPDEAVWGNMTWGHAASDDLLHWNDLPYALRPVDRYDVEGCFSGCCVDDRGTPTIVYTGVAAGSAQSQCIAASRDGLRTWEKSIHNPVLTGPPDGYGPADFRDPFVFRDPDRPERWLMVVGSCTADGRGAVLIYDSGNLVNWRLLGPLLVAADEQHGRVWECPNFFRLGDRWVLVVSLIPQGRAIYFTGDFDGRRFHPRLQGDVDNGGELYAPLTFADRSGRRLMFGWLREARSREAQVSAGWSGAMTLPRVLTIGSDGALRYDVAEEARKLRGERSIVEGREAAPGAVSLLLEHEASGEALEISAELDAGTADAVGLGVRVSPRCEEETVVFYEPSSERLVLDRSRSTLDESVSRESAAVSLKLEDEEPLSLRVFVDRSVVEVFANGRACLSARVYPTRRDATGVGLFARGGVGRLRRMDAWPLGL